jgi:hypothetical protein
MQQIISAKPHTSHNQIAKVRTVLAVGSSARSLMCDARGTTGTT